MKNKLDFFKAYIAKKGENHRYGTGAIDQEGNKYIEVWNGTNSDKVSYGRTENIIVGMPYYLGINTCGYDKASGGDGSCEIGSYKVGCTGYSKNKCAVYRLDTVELDKQKYCLSYEEILNINEQLCQDL